MRLKISGKILSWLLVFAMVVSMMPMMAFASDTGQGTVIYVSSSGNDNNDGTTSDKAVKTLSKAYEKAATTGTTTIYLLSDITVSNTLNFNSNKAVTITSAGNDEGVNDAKQIYSLKRGTTGTVLNITNGTVTLTDVIIDGNNTGSDFLVKVGSDSSNPTLTLGSGAKITNSKSGGILVGYDYKQGGYGTLNIQDGSEISCMTGAGKVNVNNNTSTTASGVLVMGTNTHFNMTGGTIKNNNANSWGTLVFCNNKGNGTAEISGGSITGNKISKSGGAGAILVDTNGRLTLNGGSITKNETTASEYGGVRLFADSSELYIGGYNDNEESGNPLVITGNTANGVESNVKLDGNKTISRVTGKTLAAGSDIGVNLASMPTEAGKSTKGVTSSEESELAYFHSDQPTKAGMVRGTNGDTAIYLSYDAREVVVSITLPNGLKTAAGSGALTQTVNISEEDGFKNIIIEPDSKQGTTFTNTTLTNLNNALRGSNLTAVIQGGKIVIAPANGKTSKDINSVTLNAGDFKTDNYYNVYGGTSTVGETGDENKMNAQYNAVTGELTWDCNKTGNFAFYPESSGVTTGSGFIRFYCIAYAVNGQNKVQLTGSGNYLNVGNVYNTAEYCSNSTTQPYISIKKWLGDKTNETGTLLIDVVLCNSQQMINNGNYHFWINAGDISEIKSTLVDFGSLPTGIELAKGVNDGALEQYVTTDNSFKTITLKPASGYLLTAEQATTINSNLDGKGLTATYNEATGNITIAQTAGSTISDVKLDLRSILSAEPVSVQAVATISGGASRNYATVESALNAANSNGSTITAITATGNNLTPVESGTLKSGVSLVTKAGTFTAKDQAAIISMDEDGNVTLTNGAVELGNNSSITGSSGQVITNTSDISTGETEKKITVTAGSTEDKDTITVPTSGSKVKIGGESGKEYETADANTVLVVDKDGNVTLTGGSVKLDKTATDEEVITIGSVEVKNTGTAGSYGTAPQITVTVNTNAVATKTGTVSIPQGGEATVGNAEIGNTSAGTGGNEITVTTDIGTGTDNNLTVTVPAGGKVTVGGVTYTSSGTVDAKLTVNPTTGKVTAITEGTVNTAVDENNWIDVDFSYELKQGESLTVGNYTYKAGTTETVTLKGRVEESGSALNPAVILSSENSSVGVTYKKGNTTFGPITYTAATEDTKFAMNQDDTNATKIDLLDNGKSENSRIKVDSGVTVTGGNNVITAAAADTIIGLDSSGKAKLFSGSGSSDSSMTAELGGADHSFVNSDGSGSYTVNVVDSTLILNTGSISVKMDDKVTFSGDNGNGKFTLEQGTDDTIIVKGAAVSSDGSTSTYGGTVTGKTAENKTDTISIVDASTKIEISTDGAIKLVDGKGSSTGTMTATIDKVGDKSFAGDNKTKYTVDTGTNTGTSGTTTGKLIIVSVDTGVTAGTVEMSLDDDNSVTLTGLKGAEEAAAEFTLGMETTNNNLTVTVPNGAGITGKSGNTANNNVTINGADSGTKVEIDESTGKMTLVDGKAKITAPNESSVTVTVAYKIKDEENNVTGIKTVDVTIPAGKTYTVDADNPSSAVKGLSESSKTGEESVGTGDDTFTINYSFISQTGETSTVDASGVVGASGAKIEDKTTGSTTSGNISVKKNVTNGKDTVIISAGSTASITYLATAGGTTTQTVRTYTAASGGSGATLLVEKVIGSDNTQTDVKVSLINGKVELAGGTTGTTSTTGESIKGIAGNTINNTSGNTDKTITVEADVINKTDTVTVPAGGKVTVETTEYEAGTGGATTVVDEDSVTLTGGTVELGKNESITGKSGQVITNTSDSSEEAEEKKITVTAGSTDTITVPTGGKVTIGSGNNAPEYEATGNGSATLAVGNSGNVALTDGSVKLDKTVTDDKAEKEVIIIGGVEVKNTGTAEGSGTAPQITVTVVTGDSGSKTGKVEIPKGGEATIGSAEIGNTSTGTDGGEKTVTTDIGTDSNLTVTVPTGGEVTIGGVTYTDTDSGGNGGATISVDSSKNKVTAITGGTVNTTVDKNNWTNVDFSYELKQGESLTVGSYTYKAGATGTVTLKGRGTDDTGKALNPAVILSSVGGSVEVTYNGDPASGPVTYTAVNEDTKFAMSADDTDATEIDLLDNDESSNSRIKVANGVTVTGENNVITAAANNTIIGLDSSKNAKLFSGSGSSTGSMTAAVDGADHSFAKSSDSDSGSYTVNVVDNMLTLNTGSTSVKMDDKVTFSEITDTNNIFTLSKVDNTTTGATIPNGATVKGADNMVVKGVTPASNEKATKVEIDSDGNLTLVDGKGISTGDMKAELDGKTYSFSKTSGDEEGTEGYTVDTATKTLTVEAGVTVKETNSGVSYTEGAFELEKGTNATVVTGVAISGDEGNKKYSGTVTGKTDNNKADTISLVDASTKIEISTDGAIKLVDGKGTSAGSMTATISGVGDKSFAGDNKTTYTVNTKADNTSTGTLKIDSVTGNDNGSVTMNLLTKDKTVTFTGEAGKEFTIGGTNEKTTVVVPAGAGISNGAANVEGLDKGTDSTGKDTKVEIDSDGNLALAEGKAEVTGESALKVPVKNAGGTSYYVDVVVPDGTTCTIDAENGSVTVKSAGKSVTMDGITYTAGKADSVFPIGSVTLINDGDKAVIPASKYAAVTVGDKSDAPVVNVSGSNSGKTTVTKGSPTNINISAAGDSFTVNGTEYKAAAGNTTYTIDNNGKVTLTGSNSGGGGTVVPTPDKDDADADNVVNKAEDKTAGTAATTTATVKTETDDNKTSAEVNTATGEDIVNGAVANKSSEVIIALDKEVSSEAAAGAVSEVALPERTVQALSEKTEASVTIRSAAMKLTLNKEAVDGLASQAGNDGYVRLVVETVKQEPEVMEMGLKLATSKGTVTDFRGGDVSVTVRLNEKLAAEDTVCVYIDEYGIYHMVTGSRNQDSTYTFVTGHFSTYAIMVRSNAEKIIAEQLARAKKLTGNIQLKASSAKTTKGNIKVTLKVTKGSKSIEKLKKLGYTVKYKYYRSTGKTGNYKAMITKSSRKYINTTGKKGTRYYYKAKVMVYDSQGKLVTNTKLSKCKYTYRKR